MKTLKLIALALFATVIVANQAVAQNTSIRMTIPFSFSVSDQPFPAGDYLFTTNGHLLQVKNVDGSATAHVLTIYVGGGPQENLMPRVILHRYGNLLFLSEVWNGQTIMGRRLLTSPAELAYARATKRETITLAAVHTLK